MTWPALCFAILLSLFLCGITSLGLVIRYRNVIGTFVGEFTSKLIIIPIQLLSGLVALFGAYALGEQKRDWFAPAISGLICIAVWTILKEALDNRIKAAEKKETKELLAIKRQAELRTDLLTAFRNVVFDQVRRLRKALNSPKKTKGAMQRLREILRIDDQLEELLYRMASTFSGFGSTTTERKNFRVGLYANRGDMLLPVAAVNLENPNSDVFKSYREHPERFRIDSTNQSSHAVRCFRSQTTLIVENCRLAAERGEFDFFDDTQPNRIGSLIAYFMDEICDRDGTILKGVLLIDTNAENHFREADREHLVFHIQEFAIRIKFEMLLAARFEL